MNRPGRLLVPPRDAFGAALVELGDEDQRLVVLDGDLANSTKSDLFAEAHPDRFLMMGIAEQNMVGVAAGLATVGFRPWCVSFAAFIANRCLDQIRVVVAQPHLNVKFAGGYSGLLTGRTGKTHQDVSDLAVMRAIPGMTVIAPADAVEVRAALRAAHAHQGPVYLRLTRDPSPVVFPSDLRFEIGRASLLVDGEDLCIVATGVETVRALEAADLLRTQGIDAGVLHMPTVKPLDVEALVTVASRTRRIVTAEDGTIIGGLGAAVAETLSERLPTPIRRVGIPDTYGQSGSNDALLEAYGVSVNHIARAALSLLHAESEGREPAS